MEPREYLDWFDDNIAWFAALSDDALTTPVPNCPGWDVGYVLSHLAVGLGLAYPHALDKAPDTPNDEGFADVLFPEVFPEGVAAREAFVRHMGACSARYRQTDPALPCWTYAGPGHAEFWFLRAAVETSMHPIDVESAFGEDHSSLSDDRVWAIVAECVGFALPLAAQLTGTEPDAMEIVMTADDGEHRIVVGSGEACATLTGSGAGLAAALWGRRVAPEPHVSGHNATAEAWLGLVEEAFAGPDNPPE